LGRKIFFFPPWAFFFLIFGVFGGGGGGLGKAVVFDFLRFSPPPPQTFSGKTSWGGGTFGIFPQLGNVAGGGAKILKIFFARPVWGENWSGTKEKGDFLGGRKAFWGFGKVGGPFVFFWKKDRGIFGVGGWGRAGADHRGKKKPPPPIWGGGGGRGKGVRKKKGGGPKKIFANFFRGPNPKPKKKRKKIFLRFFFSKKENGGEPEKGPRSRGARIFFPPRGALGGGGNFFFVPLGVLGGNPKGFPKKIGELSGFFFFFQGVGFLGPKNTRGPKIPQNRENLGPRGFLNPPGLVPKKPPGPRAFVWRGFFPNGRKLFPPF